jgi:hypothetical protein
MATILLQINLIKLLLCLIIITDNTFYIVGSNELNGFKIKWFTNRFLQDTNYNFYIQNPSIIYGYIPCCWTFIINQEGNLIQYDNSLLIYNYTNLYQYINIEPVISCPYGRSSLQFAIINPNFKIQLLTFLQIFNISGFILDCDVSYFNTQQYVAFINNLANSAHIMNKTFSVILSESMHLNNPNTLKYYNNTQLDQIITTTTFCPTLNFPFDNELYDRINWLINNVSSIKQVTIGIQIPSSSCNWTYQTLKIFLSFLFQKNIQNIAIWSSPFDLKSDIKFFINLLNEFSINGLNIANINKSQNAAYLPYGWFIHNQDITYLTNNIIQMQNLGIIYAFCNVGEINTNGSLDTMPSNFYQYITLVKQIYPQQKILAWVNGDPSIMLNISNFNKICNTIINLLTTYNIDGIHLNIEIVINSDQNFINLLSIIRPLLPNNLILSIASSYEMWDVAYIQQLNLLIDIFSPMIYDTMKKNIIDYENYVNINAQIWLQYCTKLIIVTLPTYSQNIYHNPVVENLSTAMDALYKAMNNSNGKFSGYAMWNWYEMNSIDTQLWLEKCMYTGIQSNISFNIVELSISYNSTVLVSLNTNPIWISINLFGVYGLIGAKFRIYPNDRTILWTYPANNLYSMLNNNGYINNDFFSFKLITTNTKINTSLSIEISMSNNSKSYLENILFIVQ